MPLKREVRRLGNRWPMVKERATLFAATIPREGISLAAFERAVLLDVMLSDVPEVVAALRGQGIIWTKKNRGEVRVFRCRPPDITGIMRAPEPAQAFLSASIPHVYRLAESLQRRSQAKLAGDQGAAQEARARIAICAQRVVGIARGHVSRGLAMADARRAMWAAFSQDAMDALAQFEPAFEREAKDVAFGDDEALTRARRIAARLPLPEKIAALVEKAGAAGITKTALYQAVRPKPPSIELSAVLDRLCDDRRVEARCIRIEGSGREGLRYFSGGVVAAA